VRILFWCESFWPRIGGVEVMAAGFVAELVRRGHELLIISEQQPGTALANRFHDQSVRRFPFRPALESRDVEAIGRIRDEIADLRRAFAPDLLHVYYANYCSVFERLTASAAQVPHLLTLHGVYQDRFVAANASLGAEVRAADWVVACSEAALRSVHGQVPRVKLRSSLIRSTLERAPKPLRTLPEGPPRLLCLGRLSPEKGYDVAVAAFARLVSRQPGASLTLAGGGMERERLEALAASLGVAHRVSFTGWVAPDASVDLVDEASVVVVPSRAEGLGLVAVQAAQRARPVVATLVDGLPDVVRHGQTGLLVPPDDPIALAGALQLLAENPALARRMGTAARRRALRTFSWKRHVGAYLALYYRLTGGAAASA
jgi:glycosyltransferase involved in cell wall biosynthesis